MRKIFRFRKRFQRNERGQAAVELAITLPLAVALVCGIIEFGMVFFVQISVQNAAREGARYASIHAEDAGVSAGVSALARDIPIAESASSSVSFSGDAVTVTVNADYHSSTPLGGVLFAGGTKTLSSSVTMLVEP